MVFQISLLFTKVLHADISAVSLLVDRANKAQLIMPSTSTAHRIILLAVIFSLTHATSQLNYKCAERGEACGVKTDALGRATEVLLCDHLTQVREIPNKP